MKGYASFWYAFRSFFRRTRKKKSSRPLLGAVLGVALSIIPLTVVLHLSQGMIQGITRRYLETSTYHLQSYTYFTTDEKTAREQQELIGSVEGVESVILEHQGFGLAYSVEADTGVTVRGIPKDLYTSDPGFAEYVTVRSGEFDLSEKGNAVIGDYIAEKLNIGPGDEIRILTGRVFGRNRFVPKLTRFRVTGVVSTGYQELDRMWVFVKTDDASRILSPDDSQLILGIKTADPYGDLNPLIEHLGNILPSGWLVYGWQDLNYAQQKNFQTTQTMLVLIMSMLVLVAVLNISSSMVMLVLERNHEIGILKCTGASPEGITRTFLFVGGFIGFCGTLLGLTIGVLLALNINGLISVLETIINGLWSFFSSFAGSAPERAIKLVNTSYYLERVPVTIQWGYLIVIAFATFALSLAASSIPSIRAGRIRPLDVIRKH